MLHKLSNTFLFFLSSGKSKLTGKQNQHMKTYLYCNHNDNFLYIPNPLRDQLVEYQKTGHCISCKEAL